MTGVVDVLGIILINRSAVELLGHIIVCMIELPSMTDAAMTKLMITLLISSAASELCTMLQKTFVVEVDTPLMYETCIQPKLAVMRTSLLTQGLTLLMMTMTCVVMAYITGMPMSEVKSVAV